MSDHYSAENICIDCGLCCDGTLFTQVPLTDDDDAAPLKALGFVLKDHDGKPIFDQPCAHFSKGCCQVYEGRPRVCRTYRCTLRQRYDKGEVTAEAAKALINTVRAVDWQTQIRPALEGLADTKGQSLIVSLIAAQRTVADSENPAALRQRYGVALVKAMALLSLLQKHFRPEKKVDAVDGMS